MSKLNGNVYFILNRRENLVKVGFSKNVSNRLKALKTSNPDLYLLYVIENCTMDYEKMLHNFFVNSHYKLEWFHYDDSIKEWIKRHRLTEMCRKGLI